MTANAPFPSTAPDFSDPLGLLRACHERIFQHCEMVERLAQHLAGKGLDQESREAAAKIHRYFSSAAKHHHADEEQDLFPRLAHQSLELADIVHRLKREHEQLDALWERIEPLLAKPFAIEDTAVFQALAQQFAGAYRSHARTENEEVLDIAQHLFGSDELRELGHSMAERRGVSLPTTV